MAPPAPAPAPAQPGYVYHSPWFIFRLLCLVGAVCEFIAALYLSNILHGTLGLAWLAGGISAFFLAWAAP